MSKAGIQGQAYWDIPYRSKMQNYITLVKVYSRFFFFTLPRGRVSTVPPGSDACSCTVNLQQRENQRFGKLKRG